MNELLHLLSDAVESCLRTGGRKVAVTASGGLDSSTVACLAGEGFDVFTGFYDDAGFDEREWSRLLPGRLHEVRITASDFVEEFDSMAVWLAPPWQGVGCFGQWMVARRMAAHNVEVALSGEGADELFGGYARIMLVAGEDVLPVGYDQEMSLPDGYPRDLEAALEWEMRHLTELLATDTMILGAWGIESRAPFTRPPVVRYALELPVEERVWKRQLRIAVRGVVPEPIRCRVDKMGFPVPFVKWAQEEPLRSFLLERIGWLPDPGRPWDRSAWYELLDRFCPQSAGIQIGQRRGEA